MKVALLREFSSWSSDQPTLSDGVVSLRPWSSDDVAWVFESCQDLDIQRWTRVPVPYEIKHAELLTGPLSKTAWDERKGAHFAVTETATGVRLGSIGLVAFDEGAGVAETGYWTAPEARGTGATTRALQLLADWAFESAGVVRLELLVEVENIKSRAVAERAGFHCDGEMAKKFWRHGAHRDVAMYSRTV